MAARRFVDGKQRVRIVDVAARAGVSITTVSHALSGRRPVSEATRERVQRAIEELSYRPNEAARSLRGQPTTTVAVIVPDITNPFYPQLARGMQDVLSPKGYQALICSSDAEPVSRREIVEQMLARRVDGICISGYYDDHTDAEPAVEAGVPVVLFGHRAPYPGISTVTTDDIGAGRLATEHLLSRGHERIAFISGPSISGPSISGPSDVGPPADRVAGYRAALESAGIADELVVHGPVSREGGAAGMRQLLALDHPPQAVVCTNDFVAIGAMQEALDRGLDVPGDVALVGFDDIDAAALVRPALTTMAVAIRRQGQAAAQLILDRIANPDQPPQATLFGTDLVQRQST
ncbi:LacI family DNA-binding transcriptional regulator [Kribbella sp.]|uniref:LacI family DNA-binding transcriptional regulator n=1 Tax=Kribbella sp. TaxID=1871183 RepID=UPI002D4B6379|nr:LacI family DNA-binding transcriptional regulator [Kribbella sp.]HZX03250.1 LacI family DNA-binding transcriptional regulator [Kribbella sp.]